MENKEYLYCVDEKNDIYRVSIEQDDDVSFSNPREINHLGTMICNHSKYKLGDIQDNFYLFMNNQVNTNDEDLSDRELFKKWIDSKYMVLPLNLYDHSGITMSIGFDRGWDNGVVGYIFVDKDNKEVLDYQKNNSEEETKKWVEENLRAEVATYSNYLSGEIYFAKSQKFDKVNREWIDYDSLGGIYPNNELNYQKQLEEIAENVVNAKEFISKKEVDNLISIENPLNKKAIFDAFIKNIKENISDFNNNYMSSAIHVQKTTSKDKLDIVKTYMKLLGCDEERKTCLLLKDKIFENKNFEPTRIIYGWNKTNGYDTGTLYIDDVNQRFGLVASCIASSFDHSSGKKCRAGGEKKEAENLVLQGYTETNLGRGAVNLINYTKNKDVLEILKNDIQIRENFEKKEKSIINPQKVQTVKKQVNYIEL